MLSVKSFLFFCVSESQKSEEYLFFMEGICYSFLLLTSQKCLNVSNKMCKSVQNTLVQSIKFTGFEKRQNWHFQRGLTFDFCSILKLFEALSDIQKSERASMKKFPNVDGLGGLLLV